MKATGIVRRIDDLGRVVIPEEIRRSLRIQDGDRLEIFIDQMNGQPIVCFRKYETGFLNSLISLADAIGDEMNDRWWSKRGEVRDHFDAIAELLKEFEKLGK